MKMLEQKPYHLCFETLANELRMKILEMLSHGPKSVNELAENLNAERSRVSHSLFILKGCKIVDANKKGKKMVYSLKDKTYLNTLHSGDSILGIIDSHIDNYCDSCYKLKN